MSEKENCRMRKRKPLELLGKTGIFSGRVSGRYLRDPVVFGRQ